MIGAGNLDRIVKLQSAIVSKDADYNEESKVWVTYATVRAQMDFHRSDETDANSRMYAERGLYFTIRWRSDILPEHRLIFEDEEYEIIGRPREIGRRQFLKVQARLVE